MKKNNDLIHRIYRVKTIERIKKKIKLLGISNPYDIKKYLAYRLFLCSIIFIFTIFLNYGYLIAPSLMIVTWYCYEYLTLDMKIKKRINKLDYEALFFFEVLALTLESGRNLEGSLILTSDNVKNELAREFKKTLSEIQVGKSLNEVLNTLKERIPSSAINNVILNMTQANLFGNSLLELINNQISYLRQSQILDVKEKITKLPIKVSTISVILFIPIILLLLLGPVLIQVNDQNKSNKDIISSQIVK